jgi:predicted nicotinamide N-methyase
MASECSACNNHGKKEIKKLKILEVGCGLALSSLILKLRGADITATDYNPSAKAFLIENMRINQCQEIPFIRADWKDDHLESSQRYDLIIGSDILYQQDHSKDLSHFINMKALEKCEVIIVDPNRGNQNSFTRKMRQYNFTYQRDTRQFYDLDQTLFKGHIHHYQRESKLADK